MRVHEFLSQYVEGYLFHDLNAMAALPASAPGGGAGYPMLTTMFAGMELLGGMASADPFDRRVGRWYVAEYWRVYLSRVDATLYTRERAGAAYALLRNGVAHVALPKPGVEVVKGGAPVALSYDATRGLVVVDCLALLEDFGRSYRLHYLAGGLPGTARQDRLDEMIEAYREQAKAEAKPPEPPKPPKLSQKPVRPTMTEYDALKDGLAPPTGGTILASPPQTTYVASRGIT